jgi:serine/threonine-protein kinase RsbT
MNTRRRGTNTHPSPECPRHYCGSTHAVVPLRSASDIVTARQHGRALAEQIGFAGSDPTLIASVVSELARNILEYGRSGEVILCLGQRRGRVGIVIVARDSGPGIGDSSGLGLGLPGVRRLVDHFRIVSEVQTGTTVTVKKWVPVVSGSEVTQQAASLPS